MTTAVWGWSDRLSLKFDEMDETHQEFVSLCAALTMEFGVDEFLRRLDALIAHSIIHFEQENTWMTEHDFAPIACHQREHNSVLEIMQEVRARVADGEHDLGDNLATELPHWFEHHVDTMDAMLAQFMRQIQVAQDESIA